MQYINKTNMPKSGKATIPTAQFFIYANHGNRLKHETHPADCRKLDAVDSNKHDWD